MPSKPARGCAKTGCPTLTRDPSRLCDTHRKQRDSEQDQHRGSSAERGYGSRWQKARRVYLRHNPLCKECYSKGIVEPSTTVDHITPHKGGQGLFWDESNWQPLCKEHHDRKTAKESGWGKT